MLELNRLYNLDCMEGMRDFPDNYFDVIITDPPYGVNKADWDSDFIIDWIPEAIRISKRMLVMPGCWALPTYLKEIEGHYRDLIILHSRNGMTHSAISFGNFIPVVASGEWKHESRPH
ncbi:unnamed protein product, partial [marine sediment metagenome]